MLAGTLGLVMPSHLDSDEPLVDCRQGGRTQVEINACARREADAAEEKLRALLAELSPKLKPATRPELDQIQAQWRTLRERECKWEEGLSDGGSVAPAVYATCVSALTRQRIERLRLFLCEGAGMTGPCDASRRY
jgi:uncharacterized protein YecT (DUF1311 family)